MPYHCEIEIVELSGDEWLLTQCNPPDLRVGATRDLKLSDDHPVDVGGIMVYEVTALSSDGISLTATLRGRVTKVY